MVWLGGFLGSLNKTAVNKGFPVFVAPVRDGFGASNAAVSFIFSLARAESGPTGPMAGWFIDRFGPRRALFVGALMSGGGFLALGYTTSLWAFACIYLLIVTTGANLGFSYALATLINNWFYRRKALAMSVFQAVDSLLPAVLVGVVALAIAAFTWQTTAKIIGIILLMVILPLSWFIKDAPESMGLTMDGDEPGDAQEPSRPTTARRARWAKPAWRPPEEYSMHQTLRSWAFWNLTGGTALRLIAKTGVTVHIIPIMVSKGVSEKTAAFVLGLQLFMTVPMYLLLGWAADRFPKPAVLMGASLAGTLSLALLASPFHGLGMLLAFVLLFAVCDGCAPTNWAVVGEYFGRKTFSRLRGYIQFANFPGVLFAPVFVGWWYDHHHSYAFPLWVYTGVSLAGALTFAVLKRPPSNAPVPGEETPGPQMPAAESPQASD
jgi:MFS transporter, MCT family, solute carrier family 16 (monocarboxylic acid transporters), member 13